jgi:hypothetical protein
VEALGEAVTVKRTMKRVVVSIIGPAPVSA